MVAWWFERCMCEPKLMQSLAWLCFQQALWHSELSGLSELVPHIFLCIFPYCHQKYTVGEMAYAYVFVVSVMCTGKEDLFISEI